MHVAFDEFVVDTLLHDDATGRGAALAGGAESAPESAFDGEVEVGIVEHDHGVLAAEFQGTMLKGFGGGGADDAAHFGRAGQRDSAYIAMLKKGRADAGTEPADNIDDASGQTRVGE